MAASSGGTVSTGGSASSGGLLATGGIVSSGGVTATGGRTQSGGTTGSGGLSATGGASVTTPRANRVEVRQAAERRPRAARSQPVVRLVLAAPRYPPAGPRRMVERRSLAGAEVAGRPALVVRRVQAGPDRGVERPALAERLVRAEP